MQTRPLDTLLALKAINLIPGLTGNDRAVAATLLEHFNRKTGQCDPGLERIAGLLGISTRTVIRSIHRLVAFGLFRKTRHGGHLNRNSYEPVWPRFREVEATWSARLKTGARAGATGVSPPPCQPCHLGGVSPVTQTCRSKNNLPRETYRGLPKEENGGGVASRLTQSTTGIRSRDAAEAAAERRWTNALQQQFGSLPVTYGEIVEAISPEIQAAATTAEMRRPGAGYQCILDRLRLRER